MSECTDRKELAGFLKFMGLERDKVVSGRLENRIKAQKLVYFGKKLGLPLHYDFDVYLYGPYSSKLADCYYSMAEDEWNSGTLTIPEEIKEPLHYLKNSDALFLEIAATIDSIKTVNKGISESKLIDTVSKLKTDRLKEKKKDNEYLRTVIEKLSEHKLF